MNRHQFFRSLIKNPENTSYEGKDNDEVVHLLIRRSPLALVKNIVITIIFFILPLYVFPFLFNLRYEGIAVFDRNFAFCIQIFWYLALFGYIFQWFLNWYFEVFLVTNKKIIDVDRGSTNISETFLINVEDVTSKMASVVGQVLNIGSIHIQTAAEREEFEFEMVDNPSEIRDAISDLVSKERHKNDELR